MFGMNIRVEISGTRGIERVLRGGGHMIEGPHCVSGHAHLTIAEQPGMSVNLPGEYHLFGYQEAVEKSFRLGQGLVYNILAVLAVIIDLTNFVDTVVSIIALRWQRGAL